MEACIYCFVNYFVSFYMHHCQCLRRFFVQMSIDTSLCWLISFIVEIFFVCLHISVYLRLLLRNVGVLLQCCMSPEYRSIYYSLLLRDFDRESAALTFLLNLVTVVRNSSTLPRSVNAAFSRPHLTHIFPSLSFWSSLFHCILSSGLTSSQPSLFRPYYRVASTSPLLCHLPLQPLLLFVLAFLLLYPFLCLYLSVSISFPLPYYLFSSFRQSMLCLFLSLSAPLSLSLSLCLSVSSVYLCLFLFLCVFLCLSVCLSPSLTQLHSHTNTHTSSFEILSSPKNHSSSSSSISGW